MAQQEEVKLPKGWTEVTLDQISEVITGNTPSKTEPKNYGGKYAYFKPADLDFGYMVKKSTDTLSEIGIQRARFIPAFSTLVTCIGATIGKTGYSLVDGSCNQQINALVPDDNIDNSWLYHMVCAPQLKHQVIEKASSTTLPILNKSKFSKLEIVLAPLPEQKRIVEKLDSVLAQVDTIQQRLNNLPDIIKRFRQSVLAAAVSGKLTEQWRGDSGYHESNFGFDIPDTWSLCEIQNVAEVKGGKRLPKGEELVSEDTGYRYVRAGQLKNGTIINGDMARNSQMYLKAHVQEQIKRYIVKKGDAYITIVGASIGDAGVVPNNYDGANLTENAAKICEFSKPMNSDFIGFWLRSQLIQQLIRLEIKSGAQGKLALKRIKTLPIPDISIEEQTEIVRLVEQYFALADTLEKNLANAKQRVDNLTQSILAKAFRGELVPQDPNDEPADKLLARIKAARLEAEKLEKAAKKAAKASNK